MVISGDQLFFFECGGNFLDEFSDMKGHRVHSGVVVRGGDVVGIREECRLRRQRSLMTVPTMLP